MFLIYLIIKLIWDWIQSSLNIIFFINLNLYYIFFIYFTIIYLKLYFDNIVIILLKKKNPITKGLRKEYKKLE